MAGFLEKRDIYIEPGAGPVRGALRPSVAPPPGRVQYARRVPPVELAPWVAHYWMVRWDLDEPYRPETLTHPNVQVVFEPDGASTVNGVFTAKFTRTLVGRSRVFGVKFQPGAFRGMLGRAVASIANRSLAARDVIGDAVPQRMESLEDDEDALVAAANEWLQATVPRLDEGARDAATLVQRILDDREILTVDDLAQQAATNKRSLQRLFREYVGASPKWVIRRYRLHELVEQLHAADAPLKLAETAAALGYFDQAHLLNDFRKITGVTPNQYRKRIS